MELRAASQRRPLKDQLQLGPPRQLAELPQMTVAQAKRAVQIVQVQHHVHGVNLVVNALMEIGMDPQVVVTGDGSSAQVQENIF